MIHSKTQNSNSTEHFKNLSHSHNQRQKRRKTVKSYRIKNIFGILPDDCISINSDGTCPTNYYRTLDSYNKPICCIY